MEQAAKKPIQPYTNPRAYTTRSARELDKTNSLEARSIKSDSLDQPFEKITKERIEEKSPFNGRLSTLNSIDDTQNNWFTSSTV